MKKKIKKLEILDTLLIIGIVIIGIITVIDIFIPDPIFLLDEAALTAITGLLTYLSTLIRKRINQIKNNDKESINSNDIIEITKKAKETAKKVKESRNK